MIYLRKSEWTILTLIFVYSFVPAFGGLLRVLELAGGPTIIPENPRALAAPVPIILHILSSFLFCMVGALQFLPSIRRHYLAAHRAFGCIVATSGCISAASGIWMTYSYVFPDDLQGNLLYWARIVLGSMMIGFIGCAVIAIRSRNILQHGAAMLRAYAIGQGASTQGFLITGWIILIGSEPLAPLRDGIMMFAWGFNLLVAEVVIWGLLAPKTVQAAR